MGLLAPVPTPPFTVRASGRECLTGIGDYRTAVTWAFRLLMRGSSGTDVTDATGWTCDIYGRAMTQGEEKGR